MSLDASLGCWGKGGLAAVRDNLDLSPQQEASGATGSGSSQLATSKPWSDTYSASRNASAPYHAIQVCVERARLFLVCFLPGFPCRHTTSRLRERSQPVTSMQSMNEHGSSSDFTLVPTAAVHRSQVHGQVRSTNLLERPSCRRAIGHLPAYDGLPTYMTTLSWVNPGAAPPVTLD